MAKRLIDTGLVAQTWYQDLSPKAKALYIHLLCTCDIAGVFETNYRMMSAYIGEKITEADVFDSFGRRVIPLANHDDKGILVDFVAFQCGGRLNPKVKVHASIIKRLSELGLTVGDLQSMSTHSLEYAEAQEEAAKAEEKPMPATEAQKEIDSILGSAAKGAKTEFDFGCSFDRFWASYPRKDSKHPAYLKYVLAMKKCRNDGERERLEADILRAVRVQRESEQWNKDGGRFIPMAVTWINQRRWEDVDSERASSEASERTVADIAKMLSVKGGK